MKKTTADDLLFNIAFIMLFICAFYNTTTFIALFSIVEYQNIIRVIATLIILLKSIAFDRYNIRSILLLGFIVSFGFIGLYTSHRGEFLDAIILIAGASKIDSKKMVKAYLITGTIFLQIALICSLNGTIIDYIAIRFTTGEVRHSFGIVYPTDFAAHVMFLYISYYYLRYGKRKIGFIDYLVLTGIVYLLDKYCSARLSELSLVISLLLFTYLDYRKKPGKHYMLKAVTVSSFPICALFSVTMTLAYNSSNLVWSFIDDFLFSNRLRVGKKVIDSYGFSLFGQNIKMQGMGYRINGYDETIGITYLDSSYLQLFMLYGIVIGTFVLLIFIMYSRRAAFDNDLMMCMIIIILAFSSIINQYLINIAYNPFAVIAGSFAFEALRRRKYTKSRVSIRK